VWASVLGFMVWGDVPTIGVVIGSIIVVASGIFLLVRETYPGSRWLPRRKGRRSASGK
jgi:hypothetical protein